MNEPLSATGSSTAPPAATPRAPREPATVINPERRTPAVAAAADLAGPPSSIVRRLFPQEGDALAAASADHCSGQMLGYFSIIERIRTGGMGAVFKALDTRLNRIVALKVLPPNLSRDPLIVQRFRNEAQSAAQLDHENVARVFFIGEEDALHFIAFEFVTGTNVRDLIARAGRLSIDEAVNYVLQIASALVHTAAQGVVHRDVKPSNIIITPSGRAKLVDLGLARKENRDDPAADLTVAGTTLGTFDYISPEQARDPRTADVRSDIYSLGCTLYHMLAGEPPFPQGTVLQKLLQHQGDEAPDPAARNHLVPENLSAVVRRMMAKDPRRRYQTPEQLVRDLLLVAGSMGLRSVSPEGVVWLASHAPQSTFWERHLAWMSTAALLLVIVGYMEFGGMRDLTRDRGEAGSSRATSAKRGQTQNAIAGGRSERRTSSERTTGRSFEGGQSAADTLEAGDQDRTESPAIGTEADSDDQEAPGRVLKPIPLVEAASAKGEPGFAVGPESVAQGTANGGASPGQGASTVPPARPTVAQGTIPDEPDDVNQSGGRTERPTAPSQGASSERPTASESAVAPADEDGVYLLGRDAPPDRRYSTLEAACAAVRNDGAVIELRFDGRRIETGVRVSRRVTIRPGKGFQPTIEFRPQQPTADGYQVRAISVPTGALDVIGIDLALAVDETVPADQWALFSLERPESLRLQGVSLTLLNSRRRPAAIVEIRSSPGAMMPDMPVAGMPQRPPLEIEIDSSLVRGDGDLFVIRQVESARMAVKQSAIAVDGALLTSRGHSEQSPEDARLELRLEHVTAVTTASLVSFDSGTVPRKLLPLAVLASNCIFSNADQVPLISMSGNSPTHDFRPLLSWTGQNNFYDRYPITWSIVSLEATSRSDAWDAAAWRKYWTDSGEANPRFDGVVWKRRAWTTRAFAELVAADFALDSDAAGNGAVRGATDSTDAGASLSALPRVAPGPSHSSAGTRVRE